MEYAVRSTEYPFLTSTPSAGVLVSEPAIKLGVIDLLRIRILQIMKTLITETRVIRIPHRNHFILMFEFSLAPAVMPLPKKKKYKS